MKRSIAAACLFLIAAHARAWGPDGHSVIAEIAQRRLTPAAARAVEGVLGKGHSLASVASWADDIRDQRPSTRGWHFVDMPLQDDRYLPSRDCPGGKCIVAVLERLKRRLGCESSVDRERDDLRFAVHLVGDIHQPLHTVLEARGGNEVEVEVRFAGLKCTRGCARRNFRRSLHAVWDETLITATVWDWGAYVDRLEEGWLRSRQAHEAPLGGTPAQWALDTHREARLIWQLVPADRVLGQGYYRRALPILDRQLGLAGLRLAAFLNEAYAPGRCATRHERTAR